MSAIGTYAKKNCCNWVSGECIWGDGECLVGQGKPCAWFNKTILSQAPDNIQADARKIAEAGKTDLPQGAPHATPKAIRLGKGR